MPGREPTLILGEVRALAAEQIAHEGHRALVLDLLEQHAEELLRLPATRDRAYPYRGGLVEHTLAVATLALDLASRYAGALPPAVAAAQPRPGLRRGRAARPRPRAELGGEEPPPAPTVAGRLVGPLVLGRDLVRDAARGRDDVDPEWLALLEHLLLTHSGEDVAGSKGPAIPEGLLVQYADELDLKMSLFARCLERDARAGAVHRPRPGAGPTLLKARKV